MTVFIGVPFFRSSIFLNFPFIFLKIKYLNMEKAREFQKNIYFCFIDYTKALDCGSHQSVENS